MHRGGSCIDSLDRTPNLIACLLLIENYQFAYFLAETKQHAVLIKVRLGGLVAHPCAPTKAFAVQPSQTRHFVAAPAPPPEVVPPPRAPSPVPSKQKGKKRARAPRKMPAPSQKAKQRKTKGRQRAKESSDEDVIDISSDEDASAATLVLEPSATAPRRSARARRVKAGGYRERDGDDDEEIQEVHQIHDVDGDVEMVAPLDGAQAQMEQDPAATALRMDDSNLIAMDESEESTAPQPAVKREIVEPSVGDPGPVKEIIAEIVEASTSEQDAQPMLQDEEEEDKKNLTLRLKYEGFNIQGRHLCVVVEPYPPIRAQTRAPSLAPIFDHTQRAPSIAPADYIPRGATHDGRRPLSSSLNTTESGASLQLRH